MKVNKTNLSITISSLALVAVLIIQVNWIFKTAQIKEQLFNEKANMVLSRTMEALKIDVVACGKINACVSADDSSGSSTQIGQSEREKIDSLFNFYMKQYNFHIDYTFEVVKPTFVANSNQTGFGNYSFNQPMNNGGEPSFELKLIFPSKRKYILAEMGPMFITSILLLVIVMFTFWRTIRSLKKEKEISDHTTDFLNNMTHEFKTPITNIGLAGRMMLKDADASGDKSKYYSGIILDENEKLKWQVEQMLSMTALERGEIPLQKTEIDFHQLIQEAVKQVQLQIENQQGKLELKLNETNVVLLGDKTHLLNSISNLLDNAIKYANGKPDIMVITANERNRFLISVADKGIGIEKEYQKRVFEKFYRVPTGDVHNVKGFGLGLAYIKKIVELHGGTVELHSEKGKGTQFTISLPNA